MNTKRRSPANRLESGQTLCDFAPTRRAASLLEAIAQRPNHAPSPYQWPRVPRLRAACRCPRARQKSRAPSDFPPGCMCQHHRENAARQHPGPASGQLSTMCNCIHERKYPIDGQIQTEHQPDRRWVVARPDCQNRARHKRGYCRHKRPPEAGACRAPSVMIKPTAPLKKKRQPSNIVTTTAANPGITIAATPRNKSKLPSIGSSVRARARDSCNSCAVDAPVVLDSFIRYAP